ncbi:MAG: GNAT family N-acetyltransferase [Thermomicrobiales bacterium]
MPFEHVRPDQIVEIDTILKHWEGLYGTDTGFSSGDLGWALRHGLEEASKQLRIIRTKDNDIGAIGTLESATAIWLSIDPSRLMDFDLAEAIGESAVAAGFAEVSTASTPALVRRALAARGYAIDPLPWVHLWKSLTDDDIRDQPNVYSTMNPDLIERRIAVNVSAFENSTFSRAKWESMARGPSFVPQLDLVALNEEGQGVSALTAWLPGPDACGVIEPMGTHADHRRQGHGLRVLRACFAELRKLGASGVRVFTPRENDSAVAAYQAAGFRVIDLDTTMVRQRP